MTIATLVESPTATGSCTVLPPEPTSTPAPASSEALSERIAALAAHLHATTYELLVLLRQFDASPGWHGGFASSAHWLHWRTGIAGSPGCAEGAWARR